jgi:hypothetical protein
MGWCYPYLGVSVYDDATRIMGWIDHLEVDKGHPASTVDTYLTGIKQQLGERGVISEALGKVREPRHSLVVCALRSVAESAATRIDFPAAWIREGRSDWAIPVYVAVVVIFMASLRAGELIGDYAGKKGRHILLWENLTFLKSDEVHGNRAMSREEIGRVCADLVQIKFVSRKFQSRGKVRVIPPLVRAFYPASGLPDVNLFDFSLSVDLCAVTLLQSWFIALGSLGELPTLSQPVMQGVAGHLVDSCEVIECLRRVAARHGVEKRNVVIHCLKHGSLTALGEAGANAIDIATAGGHKTIESSTPYLHPSEDQGRRNAEILGRKRRLGRGDV